ncbi:hypothetical protein ASU91_17355 [Enterobacter hormaechei subsp. steigerwaltii]|nr:hypothetical protein SG70_25100 [Enterobacter hormaechei subsp. steigerwaltii]KTH34521.1 hypothetical protein ASV27_24780 [Enterobacter hormaechei subsp. steigerwaltii]KTJ10176.1 hypothetical protein ASU91_17355 [Enterobacter hormaechei subsp. steigerwaltii]
MRFTRVVKQVHQWVVQEIHQMVHHIHQGVVQEIHPESVTLLNQSKNQKTLLVRTLRRRAEN